MADVMPTAHVDRETVRRRTSTPAPDKHFLYENDKGVPPPTDNLVNALLTDLYQITMCYAYWYVMCAQMMLHGAESPRAAPCLP